MATVGEEFLVVKLTLWTVLILALVALGYLGVGLFIAARLSAPAVGWRSGPPPAWVSGTAM